jgi:hypothetical protein
VSEQEITLKNTKTEIFEALQQALKRAELAEKGKLNPEKEEKEKIEKRAIDTARKAVEQNIFSKELNDKFNDLQIAIAAEENRLQELYGVGRELQKLTVIIETGKERLEAIDVQAAAKEAEAAERLQKLNEEYAARKEELQAEFDRMAEKLKLERTRENEEYEYNLVRAREREDNAWADEKATREAELLKREEQAAAMLAEAESKADYIRTLEEKVAGIPELLENQKKSVTAEVSEALRKEYENKATLAEKDYSNTVARLEDKIVFLEKEIENSNKAVVALQNKLDKAYTEIREIATKTVESAGGVKIIGNADNRNV